MRPGLGRKFLMALGVLVLLFAACGPAATPTPTATPRPVATPTPGATPVPTPTPLPPTATPTPGPKYGGVLRHRVLRDVESWDPGRDWSYIGETSLWAYPRLYSYFRGGPGAEPCQFLPIQPELATGFKWVDDTTLDVTIRQGVHLPQVAPLNGREVTADDVAFVYKRVFFETKMNPMVVVGKTTESVTVVDKYTVRFKLKSPFADYPQLALAYHSMPILPKEMLDKPGDPSGRYQWEGYRDGAYGRFRPTKWAPAVSVEMERNPDFFMKGLPYLDGVSLLIVPEETTFMSLMRAGRMDSGLTRDATVIADNARMKDVPQEVCPYAGALRGFMNTNRPEFRDVNVRRAISMALDREALNKVVFQGLGKDLYSIMTLALGRQWAMDRDDYPPEVRRYLTYDVKAAKELMAKSAYPNGFTTKIIYWPKMAGTRPTAEAISSMLAKIGIEVKLDEVNREEYIATIRGFPWDKPDTRHTGFLIGLIYWTAVDNLWDYTQSKSVRNRSAINDPKLDAMLAEQRRTVDTAKRVQIVKDIQTYLVDNMYMLPLPTGPHAEVHQPYVKGFYHKTYGWYDGEVMRDAWMDK